MADRDIKNIVVNSDGWSINVTFENMSSGGVHNLNFGEYNNPSNSYIQLTCTDSSFLNGEVTTKQRTLYAVPDITHTAMRKVYPDQATPDETISGSDLIVRYALSEHIYTETTNITANCNSGIYSVGGNPSNSLTDFPVTNNSTNTYSNIKPIFKFFEVQRDIKTGDFTLEMGGFQGYAENKKSLDCIKITITDEHSNSLNYTLTTQSISSREDYNKVICYSQLVPVSSFVSGDLLTINAVIYPIIGDSSNVIDSSLTGFTFPTSGLCDLQFKLLKNSEFGHVCVTSGGNDGTGQVYATQELAEAGSSFLTISAALTALQSYHNSNFSRNHVGGGFVYLGEGTWTYNSTNGGTSDCWCTITRMSDTTKSNVVLQAAAANSRHTHFCKLYDIYHTGSTYFYGAGVDFLWVDNVSLSKTGTVALTHNCTYGSSTYCTGSLTANKGYNSFGGTRMDFALIRGCNHDTITPSIGYCNIGNYNVSKIDIAAGSSALVPNNGIYAYNRTSSNFRVITLGVNYATEGYAIIQNICELPNSSVEAIAVIHGDSSLMESNNILIFNNTFPGQRVNHAYNDTHRASPTYHTNWFMKNNILMTNIKDDTFLMDPDLLGDANCIGGWSVGYHVNCSNNLWRSFNNEEWAGEFTGLNTKEGTPSIPLEPEFIDDKSNWGDQVGGGDYHLQESSPAYTGSILILPFDIEGTPRVSNGSIGAYEMVSLSTLKFLAIKYYLGE